MNSMHVSMFALSVLAALAACTQKQGDCPDGFARDNDGNCVELSDGGEGEGGNGGGEGEGEGENGGEGEGEGEGESGAGVGDVCFSQEDCASGLICVVENGSDDQGICTETCDSWSDCSEAFWECCDIDNGTTACIPDNWLTGEEECN